MTDITIIYLDDYEETYEKVVTHGYGASFFEISQSIDEVHAIPLCNIRKIIYESL